MKRHILLTTILGLGVLAGAFALCVAPAAMAQKGMGSESGVSRLKVKPGVTILSGVVRKVDSHPCENTTGPAPIGTHVLVRGDGGKPLNIHLGPADEVRDLAKKLKPGERIKVEAFRTGKMPDNHFVAKTVYVGGEAVHLRDNRLRPHWAGSKRKGKKQRRFFGRHSRKPGGNAERARGLIWRICE